MFDYEFEDIQKIAAAAIACKKLGGTLDSIAEGRVWKIPSYQAKNHIAPFLLEFVGDDLHIRRQGEAKGILAEANNPAFFRRNLECLLAPPDKARTAKPYCLVGAGDKPVLSIVWAEAPYVARQKVHFPVKTIVEAGESAIELYHIMV